MEAIAKLKSVPMSARKMRLVVNNVRGKKVDKALGILKYTKRESSIWLEKLLISAISNWEQKTSGESAEKYDLYIKTAFADAGSQLKRFRPAPHGRAHRIRKHSCHVTFIVENRIQLSNEGKETDNNDSE